MRLRRRANQKRGPGRPRDGDVVSVAGERRIVLELRKASKLYAGSPPVRALDRVSLHVTEGEWVSIVGPSGSGKSTMLHLIGALDLPSRGTVLIAGSDVRRLRDRELSALRGTQIGFVFQQFHLLEGLSALDNVAAGLLYRGITPAERRRRAAGALERVGLGHRLRHRPGELSGGEKQRVAIARAVVGEPAIVLADEPTGNLDSKTGVEVIDVFRSLHDVGHTIVLITHDPGVAAAAPRTISLRDGQVESDTVRSGPSHPDDSGGAAVAAQGGRAGSGGGSRSDGVSRGRAQAEGVTP